MPSMVCKRLATGLVAWRSLLRATCWRGTSTASQRRTLASSYQGLSFSQGPSEPPLLTQTIPEHFSQVVSLHGDLPAVIARASTALTSSPASTSTPLPPASTTVLTYASLDALSNTLASSLRTLGIRKGDRLAVSLGNGAEFAALTYAAFKLGAVLVPLNPGFNAKQVGAALRHLSVEVLVIGKVTDLPYKPCRGRSNLDLLRTLVPDLDKGKVESEQVPSLKTVIVLDNAASHPLVDFPAFRALTPYEVLLDGFDGPIVPDAPLDPGETINIQFTSGTTSHPKAAMLTHTGILNNGHLIAQRMGLVPRDRIVVPPPLFHCFGCVLGYMATATSGAAILFPSPAFDPAATVKMVADYDATGLYGVATMFVAVMEALAAGSAARPEDMPRGLRKGIAAGSSVPESLMRRLYETLGLRDLVICYGMTETSPVSCMTAPNDAFEKRTGSVGRAMPHTAVKIVDPLDRGRIVPRGERGELAAAGYLVMKGYWGDEEKTREVRREEADGRVWMYSGDEALMDDEGYVQITGRIKDLIIRAGENIHPLEVENCLFQMDGVKEAAVVGVPDEKLGESVAAFVVPQKGWVVDGEGSAGEKEGITKEGVRRWVREHLSSHMVPKHVFWVDEYPKTPSGKIMKFKLRDMAKELLQADEKS